MTTKTTLLDLIEKAKKPNDWKFGNEILYKLCRDHPMHTDCGQVIAKIWLIGRSYAAAIERGRMIKKTNDDFYVNTVGPEICGSAIDSWLGDFTESQWSEETLMKSIDVHGKTTELFREISGKSKRSLASKYLHFHLPDFFFIYDSRAVTGLSKLSSLFERASRNNDRGDNEYRKFAEKCLKLRDEIYCKSGHTLKPRQLDNLLLSVEETETETLSLCWEEGQR